MNWLNYALLSSHVRPKLSLFYSVEDFPLLEALAAKDGNALVTDITLRRYSFLRNSYYKTTVETSHFCIGSGVEHLIVYFGLPRHGQD